MQGKRDLALSSAYFTGNPVYRDLVQLASVLQEARTREAQRYGTTIFARLLSEALLPVAILTNSSRTVS